jgi:hypothetical protein
LAEPLTTGNELSKALRLGVSFWTKAAQWVKTWIHEDALQGKLQGDPQVQPYRPLPNKYPLYKANGMRRVTFDTNSTRQSGSKLKKSGDRFKSGNERLKGYSGGNYNTDTSSVNMILSGKTIMGLHASQVDDDGVTMSYPKSSEGAIKGNEALGRNIRTLSQENQDKLKESIAEQLDKSIKDVLKQRLVIDIKI